MSANLLGFQLPMLLQRSPHDVGSMTSTHRIDIGLSKKRCVIPSESKASCRLILSQRQAATMPHTFRHRMGEHYDGLRGESLPFAITEELADDETIACRNRRHRRQTRMRSSHISWQPTDETGGGAPSISC